MDTKKIIAGIIVRHQISYRRAQSTLYRLLTTSQKEFPQIEGTRRRPKRPDMSWLIMLFPMFVGLGATFIVFCSVINYPLWTYIWSVFFVGSYWLVWVARHFRAQKGFFNQLDHLGLATYRSVRRLTRKWFLIRLLLMPDLDPNASFEYFRSLGITFALFIFLLPFYILDSPDISNTSNTIWLLFVLASFNASQHDRTARVIRVVALGSVLLIILLMINKWVNWEKTSSDVLGVLTYFMGTITPRIIWLITLSLIPHILLRYIMDGSSDLQLMTKLQTDIMELQTGKDKLGLLQRVVDRIYSDLRYMHVQVLWLIPEGMQMLVGASAGGKQLASEGFLVPCGVGIVNEVALTGKTYASNDVLIDPHFVDREELPGVRSELAVPIFQNGKVAGVLDIQAGAIGYFLQNEQRMFELLASYLEIVLDNLDVHAEIQKDLAWNRTVSRLLQSMTYRMLQAPDGSNLLTEIARIGLNSLGADIVVVYERNVASGGIKRSISQTRHNELPIIHSTEDPSERIRHLLQDGQRAYFHDEVSPTTSEDPLFAPTEYHRSHDILPFDQRYKIRSRVIMRLGPDKDPVGMIFLNFLTPRVFNDRNRSVYETFAELVTLAIQRAQSHESELEQQRLTLSLRIHDDIKNDIFALEKYLKYLSKGLKKFPEYAIELKETRTLLARLSTRVLHLDKELRDGLMPTNEAPSAKPSEYLQQLIDELQQLHRHVTINSRFSGDATHISAHMLEDLSLIIKEAISNAQRHAQPDTIDLHMTVSEAVVLLCIKDNGTGFEVNDSGENGGVSNMKRRTMRHKGVFDLISAYNCGTEIRIALPLLPVDMEKEIEK